MPGISSAVLIAINYIGASATAVAAGSASLAQIATVAAVGIGAGVAGTQGAKLLSPQVGSTGSNVQWHADPDEPLRFAFGRVGVKGSIKDAAVYGPDRMYVSFACTVSAAGPIKRFVSFRANDYFVSFNSGGMATTGPYANEMWLSTRLGLQPDTALSLPSNLKNGVAFPGWGSDRKMSGSAAYMVTLGENSKRSAYDGRVPSFLLTIEGLFCYDPRLDSTYPGGSGPCRLNDPATWVWTDNPILFALKWTLGLWEGPVGKGAPGVDYQVGGIGVSVSSIHMASVVEAANINDANAWKGAAWPSTDDDKAQVLDGFLKAAGAVYGEIAGKIAFIHRAAPRSTVFTVTGRDTAGPVELDTTASRLNRINTIRPRYWAEDQEWQMTALPEVTSTVWQTEDGQGVAVKRTRGVDFGFVPLAKQARELATLEIAHGREGIRGRVSLRPYMDPEPGNCFTFDEPDFALAGVKCFVLSAEDDTENDTVIVTFETETDGKYPFAYGQTASPPPPQELSPVDPTFVSPPGTGDWTVTPRPAGTGGGLPIFDLTGAVNNATATAVLVEWGLTSDPTDAGNWRQAYEGPPTATDIPLVGIQPGTVYYVAVRNRRDSNYSTRAVFGPYTAPALVAGDVLPTSPTIQQINDDLAEVFGDFTDLDAVVAAARLDLEAADAATNAALDQARSDLAAVDAALYGNVVFLNQGLAEARSDTSELYDNVVALDSGLSGVQDIVSEQTVTLAGKASQVDLALQVVRIDDAAAINASQSSALVDLDLGKVEQSEYEVLRGEVLDARNGAPSLLGQIQYLQSVDIELNARKVELSAFSELLARTDGIEAVNATQALALIDVELGKVELSEYEVLRGEVLEARNGAPSLLGQIQYLQSVDIDIAARKVELSVFENLEGEVVGARDGEPTLGGALAGLKSVQIGDNAARVADIESLSARSDDTEAAVLGISQAVVDEAGTRASEIEQVRAGSRARFNHLKNGSGELGTAGVTVRHSYNGATTMLNLSTLGGTWGPQFDVGVFGPGVYEIEWEAVVANSGRLWTVTGDTAMFGIASADFSYFDVIFTDGAGAAIPGGDGGQNPVSGPHDFSEAGANRDAYAVAALAPAGAAKVKARLVISVASLNPSVIRIRQVKLEQGALPATAYSRDATDLAVGASVENIRQAQTSESELRALEVLALTTQADGLAGDIFSLNEAVLDLDAKTVDLTSFELLEGEVAGARGGQGSLGGAISNLRDLQISGDESNATAIDNLNTRTATTEADILDLDIAISTEAMSRAAAIEEVRARQTINQNLMPNGSGESGTTGYAGLGVQVVDVPNNGGTFVKFVFAGSVVDSYITCPRAKVDAGQTVTLQWRAAVEGTFTGAMDAYIVWLNAAGGYVTETGRKSVTPEVPTITAVVPAGAAFAMMAVFVNGNAGSGVNLLLRAIKIENGPRATIYSSDRTQLQLAADVVVSRLAIIDLELQQAVASYEVAAEASGGDPALLRLVSSTLGGYAALLAPQLVFETNGGGTRIKAMEIIDGIVTIMNRLNVGNADFFIDAATKTMQAVAGAARVVIGAPFGTDNRILWYGNKTIALSAMSAGNSIVSFGGDLTPTLPGGTSGSSGYAEGSKQFDTVIDASSGWSDVEPFTMRGVPLSGAMSVTVAQVGGGTGEESVVQWRVREASSGVVVAGPSDNHTIQAGLSPAEASALFGGTVSASGTVQYYLQKRTQSFSGGGGISSTFEISVGVTQNI